ncbi:MAG TPA: hypothetical protein PLX08_09895 [Bacteroidales bacterium]|jgi:hypothetical protein|nr:hypothetical protein [Bacteroidales bacterium]
MVGRENLTERGYELMPPNNREIHDAGIIRAEGRITEGEDAVNEFSFLILDSVGRMRL